MVPYPPALPLERKPGADTVPASRPNRPNLRKHSARPLPRPPARTPCPSQPPPDEVGKAGGRHGGERRREAAPKPLQELRGAILRKAPGPRTSPSPLGRPLGEPRPSLDAFAPRLLCEGRCMGKARQPTLCRRRRPQKTPGRTAVVARPGPVKSRRWARTEAASGVPAADPEVPWARRRRPANGRPATAVRARRPCLGGGPAPARSRRAPWCPSLWAVGTRRRCGCRGPRSPPCCR